jgi:hypothetical protein
MKTLFVLAGIFFLTFAVPARAGDPPPMPCGCTEKAVSVRFHDADAVFTGTVREIASENTVIRKGSGRWSKRLMQADPPVTVMLDIDKSWKGVPAKKTELTLHTSLTKYTCAGYPFEKGRKYLVFAYRREESQHDDTTLYSYEPGTYEVGGLCGGTKEIEKADDDLAHIKAEDPPSDEPEPKKKGGAAHE